MALLRCVGTVTPWKSMTKRLHSNLNDSGNTGVLLTTAGGMLSGALQSEEGPERQETGFQAPRSLPVCTT